MTSRGNQAGLAALVLASVMISSGCQGFALLDQPPVAKFTVWPSLGALRVGEAVTLDASESSDPQGYALTYEWELRAPSQSLTRLSSTTGKIVTFYPDAPSQFTVSLTVTARVQSDYSGTTFLNVGDIDPEKVLLKVVTDGNGAVDPWGVRAFKRQTQVLLQAVAKNGYKFVGWTVEPGTTPMDTKEPVTLLTLGTADVVVEAAFASTSPPPQFLGWKKTYPNGLLSFEGQSGAVTAVGDGGGGQMVALTWGPGGSLFGAGSPFAPIGAQLFVVNRVQGSVEGGLDFRFSGSLVSVAGLAFSPKYGMFAVEDGDLPRIFAVNSETGVLTLVGTPYRALDSLAFSPQGVLYGSDGSQLYKLDPQNGSPERIGTFGTMVSLSSLTFGPEGALYAADDLDPATIYTVDTTSGSANALVTLGSGGLLSLVVEP